jgi:hypothetical protein
MPQRIRNSRIEDEGWKTATARPPARAIRCLLFSVLALFLLVLPTGCFVLGAVAHKIAGPPAIKARYVPVKEPMLVLVENFHNPAATRLEAQRLAALVAELLERHKVAPVVRPARLTEVQARPDYPTMTIPAVGRAAGARQVLYVNLRQFDVERTTGGDMMKVRAEMLVRVVGAAVGRTRWPVESPQGYTVTAEGPWVRTAGGGGTEKTASEPLLRDQALRDAADQIAKLFRNWKPDEG